MPKNYFLKEEYKQNSQVVFPMKIEDIEITTIYQDEVYKLARKIIKKYKIKSVLDVGCGFGKKLEKYIHPICKDITGIDTSKITQQMKISNNFGIWIVDNIESPFYVLKRKFDLIISADVIEHLDDPDKLLDYIKKYAHNNSIIIISTPERDLVRGKNNFGPPSNPLHVREWNKDEFNKYISSQGFIILKHILLNDFKKSLIRKFITLLKNKKNRTCQTIICKLA